MAKLITSKTPKRRLSMRSASMLGVRGEEEETSEHPQPTGIDLRAPHKTTPQIQGAGIKWN